MNDPFNFRMFFNPWHFFDIYWNSGTAKGIICGDVDKGIIPLYNSRFNGSRAIVSGPAGGVVGYALTTYNRVSSLPVIGFDMGGES